jgi:hypothetical protein
MFSWIFPETSQWSYTSYNIQTKDSKLKYESKHVQNKMNLARTATKLPKPPHSYKVVTVTQASNFCKWYLKSIKGEELKPQ